MPIEAFDLDKLPAHLRVTFVVESADGRELGRGKDLDAFRSSWPRPRRTAVAEAVADGLERTGLRAWPDDLAELPRTVERRTAGRIVRGFPALTDAGTTVDVRVFATEAEQAAAMGPGTRRLLRLASPSPVKAVERALDPRARLALSTIPTVRWQRLLDDCADAAVDVLASRRRGPGPTSPRCGTGWPGALTATTLDVVARVQKVLDAAQRCAAGPARQTAARAGRGGRRHPRPVRPACCRSGSSPPPASPT